MFQHQAAQLRMLKAEFAAFNPMQGSFIAVGLANHFLGEFRIAVVENQRADVVHHAGHEQALGP